MRSQIQIQSPEIERKLRSALEDRKAVEQVRQLVGEQALTPAKIWNWKTRGYPPAFWEGAAVAWVARERAAAQDDGTGVPVELQRTHLDALTRTKMWARAVYHVFVVDEKEGEAGLHACHTYRYWEAVTSFDTREGCLAHTTVSEGACRDFRSLGDVEMKLLGTPLPRGGLLGCQAIFPAKKTVRLGYRITVGNAMRGRREEERNYDFLGGTNVIPCLRSYLVAAIPQRLVAGLSCPYISFAPQISPLDFLTMVVAQVNLRALLDRQTELFFEPWGKFGPMQEGMGELALPSGLLEALKTDGVWPDVPGVPGGYRCFTAAFELPSPLTNQTMLFRLP